MKPCSKPDCLNPARANQKYCKGCHALNMRLFRRIHPLTRLQREKMNARCYLNTYIKRGAISREPCAVCGVEESIEGHHPDYRKPLCVIWLCKSHHILVTKGIYLLPPEMIQRCLAAPKFVREVRYRKDSPHERLRNLVKGVVRQASPTHTRRGKASNELDSQ